MAVQTPTATFTNEDFAQVGSTTRMGRWLRQFWHPIALAEELQPGRAVPARLLGEDLTLYRGEGGDPHLVAFRCAHRGTQLSTGWVEGDNLRCFYHGWVYDGNGQCVEQPAEPEPFCSRIKLKSYPVQEYLGMVFAYLGEGDPPPLRRFPSFEDETDGVHELHTYSWPCSFVNSIENDPVHTLFVHRETAQAAGRTGYPTIACAETSDGFDMTQTFPSGRSTVTHHYLPNVGHNTGRTVAGIDAWREAIFWRVPVDEDHFASFSVTLTHVEGSEKERFLAHLVECERRAAQETDARELAEAVLRGELRIEDIPGLRDNQTRLFNVQDYVSQVGQGRLSDLQQEYLGRTDATVVMQRALWSRALRALDENPTAD
jgi:5,5'-dehydrodivanillate O-demethylase oxygenase subunit